MRCSSSLEEFVKRLIGCVVVAAIISSLFLWRFMAARVVSESMSPTLEVGTRLLGSRDAEVKEGDIILFARDGKVVVKRVIACDGSPLEIVDGRVFVDDKELDESEYAVGLTTGEIKTVVPSGKLFVMGDNREHSLDSRVYGFIDEDDVLAVVIWKLK